MRPGERIGNYTIVRKIGEGGMSIVYLAERLTDGKAVVVKQLKDQYRFDEQLVDRFIQGAKILQELRHAHLARVFDCLDHRGTYFMVEEYLPGGSLGDAIDAEECAYTEAEAVRWCRDALRAMDYAHQHAIIHRDLKPSNLMLDENRQVKVIDFGIARVFGEARITRTVAGVSLGTVEYMSPEQILDPRSVDHMSDVYSMGVVLYELLTGTLPFSAPSVFEVQEKVTRQRPPSLRRAKPGMRRLAPDATGIDARLAAIVLRALDKRPHRRFGGCNEFARQLDRYLKGELSGGVLARPRAALRAAGRILGQASAGAGAAGQRIGASLRGAATSPPVWRIGVGTVMLLVMLAAGVLAWRKVVPVSAPPPALAPAIALSADVSPAVLEAPGSVLRYRYQVTNAGGVPLKNVQVVAEGLTPRLESGDANGNASLDAGETWTYVATLEATQAMVDSGAPIVTRAEARSAEATSSPQRIEVIVKPEAAVSIASLVNGMEAASMADPGQAVFTYRVANAGNVSLTNVTVVDQHNAAPVLLRGDTNKNGVLDVGETWEYRARVPIGRSEDGRPQTFVSRAIANRATSEPDAVTVTVLPARPIPLPPGSLSPRKLINVRPEYPEDAKAARVGGVVVVSVTVGATGRVDNATIVRSVPLLDRAALEAVRQWVYEPPIVNGAPQAVYFNVSIEFDPPAAAAPPPPPVLAAPPPSPVPGVARTGPGGVVLPVRIHHVAPVYPAGARAGGVTGTVIVAVEVQEDGSVRKPRVLKSIPLLDQAALEAVRQFRYRPATTPNGKPMTYTHLEYVTFPPVP